MHQVRSEEEREPVLAQASLRRVECCVRAAVAALRAESRLPDALFVAHNSACDEECVGDEGRLRDCSDCVRELCDWLPRVFRLLEPRLLGSCDASDEQCGESDNDSENQEESLVVVEADVFVDFEGSEEACQDARDSADDVVDVLHPDLLRVGAVVRQDCPHRAAADGRAGEPEENENDEDGSCCTFCMRLPRRWASLFHPRRRQRACRRGRRLQARPSRSSFAPLASALASEGAECRLHEEHANDASEEDAGVCCACDADFCHDWRRQLENQAPVCLVEEGSSRPCEHSRIESFSLLLKGIQSSFRTIFYSRF